MNFMYYIIIIITELSWICYTFAYWFTQLSFCWLKVCFNKFSSIQFSCTKCCQSFFSSFMLILSLVLSGRVSRLPVSFAWAYVIRSICQWFAISLENYATASAAVHWWRWRRWWWCSQAWVPRLQKIFLEGSKIFLLIGLPIKMSYS